MDDIVSAAPLTDGALRTWRDALDDNRAWLAEQGIPYLFLLNRNRLNVAVSRAKYAAVIVRSAALTEYLPSTPAGLVELGAFLALSGADDRDV